MTDKPKDLMAALKSSLGTPDEPIDLDAIRRDCRQTTVLVHVDQALVPLTTARRHALDLCDEIERLRERGIRYDDAIEKLRGDWAGERDKVLALQARIDAALAALNRHGAITARCGGDRD